MRRCLQLRCASSAPSASAAPLARLAALRRRLEEEDVHGGASLSAPPPPLQTFSAAGCAPLVSADDESVAAGTATGVGVGRHGGPPKPPWLRVAAPSGEAAARASAMLADVRALNLATVCEEARCPNLGECWSGGKSGVATATIMLMGDTCTRGCYFCAVKTSRAPPPLDAGEPARVADAVARWGLGYVVLTSVDRDELLDQGAGHFAETVRGIKAARPSTLVECLTPDFRGDHACIDTVVASGLDVFAHNVETVPELQARVRDHRAGWAQSLSVLTRARTAAEASGKALITKTSFMLGVGEDAAGLRAALRELADARVDVVTFGQYLRPSPRHMPVARYVHPDEFEAWKAEALSLGFLYVAAGPLVRSSYKAGEYFLENELRRRQQQSATAAAAAAGSAEPAQAAARARMNASAL